MYCIISRDFAKFFYERNGQGDIIGLVDSNMNEVVSYSYDSWSKLLGIGGSLASSVGTLNPFRYRDYYYDTETGLYYLNSRYYDPNTGRFLNADGAVSTGTGMLGHNMFVYCNNNPALMHDDGGDRPAVGSGIGGEEYSEITQSITAMYPAGHKIASANSNSTSKSNSTGKTARNVDSAISSVSTVITTTGDDLIAKAVSNAPKITEKLLPFAVHTLQHNDFAEIMEDVGKGGGPLGFLGLGMQYRMHQETYVGWDIVKAISLDTLGFAVGVVAAAGISYFIAPVGIAIAASIVVGMGISYGVDIAKDALLKKSEATK